MGFTMLLENELVVDNFAGGGGASDGIERAIKRSVDIAINHDAASIDMHSLNHPLATHFQEDVWGVDPVEVCKGRPVGLGWYSPDCRHFSRAASSTPRSKNIRGLAWIVVRWAASVSVRNIALENRRVFNVVSSG